MIKNRFLTGLLFFGLTFSLFAQVKIVSTFSDFASIAKEIGGDLVNVEYLSHGDQDPHFVSPKPSLALKLRKADMLITSGMDLELWITTLQDKARNKKIMEGAIGFVTAKPGLNILEKPASLSRDQGDVHIMGNPHFHTTPLNWPQISENILAGLKKVDPGNAEVYTSNQQKFVNRVWNSTFGEELVQLFTGEQLMELLRAGTLFEFLESDYEEGQLIDLLGGWMKKALPFRDKEIVAYHKNWSYFASDFGLRILGFIEPKPGIPPTPKHVEETIQLIRESGVDVMLVASYFEKRKPNTIAQKTGIEALFLPLSVGGESNLDDNFKLMDYWIDEINKVITE